MEEHEEESQKKFVLICVICGEKKQKKDILTYCIKT